MDKKYYTAERSQQIVIALLKAYGIRKIVASPGTTNYTLVASMQQDSFFEIYSSVDERSAAYMACGLASESGEPVVITCTGATASRNYMPGLTEAFYRKLPIVAITATQGDYKIGHHIAQVIDRTSLPKDIVNMSVHVQTCRDSNDEWNAEIKVNQALLELSHRGGGPVHINLETTYSRDFSVKDLPSVRVIKRITQNDSFPEIPTGRVGIFVGSHSKWSEKSTKIIDDFCASNNAVVFCDHTSNYFGKYRVNFSLVSSQDLYRTELTDLSLLIHVGEVSGEYYGFGRLKGKQVWRVSEDGILRDSFRNLCCVFEMPESIFFSRYIYKTKSTFLNNNLQRYKDEVSKIERMLPELPFSNIWMASQMAKKLPNGSIIHFGILGSLRAWNFFEIPNISSSSSNVGGFGIDGGISTLIGASLANPAVLHFGVVGDLAFFYDLNAVGNRHICTNLRILLVNNGKGAEFRLYWHPASAFGEEADKFMAAAGHYGNKSRSLVKNYTEDLGFEYLSASSKEEFLMQYERFLTPEYTNKPMIFEVFTDSADENCALYKSRNVLKNSNYAKRQVVGVAKKAVKCVVGENVANILKKIIK